jgi:hypothetical protein
MVTGPGRVLEQGRQRVEWVVRFDEAFPSALHFVSYYTGTHGRTCWNAQARIGSWELTGQADLEINRLWGSLVASRLPRFHLVEITNVITSPDGTSTIEYGRNFDFGPDDWDEFVSTGRLRGEAVLASRPSSEVRPATRPR